MRNIYILFAGRFPSEKAASLFVDLNARSLAAEGVNVTVLAPRRLGRDSVTPVPYTVRYLPTVDLSRVPVLWNVANFISVYVFAKWAYLWLLFKSESDGLVISNDAWPLLVATLVRSNTMYEMHDFARDAWMYRALLRRVRFVLVTNEWKRDELQKRFAVPADKILLERNAVDIDAFGTQTKEAARADLGLDPAAKLVVYTGHLYEWKGADTLARAAALVPEATFMFVGGAPDDVQKFTKVWGSTQNVKIVGHVPHDRVPLWQSAADVLVLPNSGKEEISVHYTSPMKLFEYMASRRPIVASDLPSIREVLGDNGFYATADDSTSFVTAIKDALTAGDQKPEAARLVVGEFAWDVRAKRILQRTL